MKRSLIFLMGILAACGAVLFVLNEQYADNLYMSALGKPEASVSLTIPDFPDDDLLPELKRLSDEYNCSFFREDYIEENGQSILYRSGIFAPDYWTASDFPLLSGYLPTQEDEFLATWDAHNPHQTGIIRDRFHDMPMVFQNLKMNDSSLEGEGTWILCSSWEDQNQIVDSLAAWSNIPAAQLKETGWTRQYSAGPSKLITVALMILLLVYGALCLFYPFSRSREISIKHLLGWKRIDIWWSLMKPVLLTGSLWCLSGIGIPLVLFSGLDLELIMKLAGIEAAVWLFCFILSGISFIVIRSFSSVSLLKNQKRMRIPYTAALMMKAVTLIVLALVLNSLITLTTVGLELFQELQAYARAEDMLTISSFQYTGSEFSQMLNGSTVLDDKFKAFFTEAEKTAEAGYFSASSYDAAYFSNLNADINGYEHPLVLIKMNMNEMERYQSWLPESVDSYFQNDGITVITPESFSDEMNELAEICVRSPYELQGQEIQIHMAAYPDSGRPFFTQNSFLSIEGLTFTDQPVFVALKGKEFEDAGSLCTGPPNNPLRIPNNEQNREAAQAALINAGLKNNQVILAPLAAVSRKETTSSIQTYAVITLCAAGFLLFSDIVSSWFLILILLHLRRKEIFIDRLLGLPFIKRYQSEILSLLVIWSLSFAVFFWMKPGMKELLCFTALLLTDCVFLLLLIGRLESHSAKMILKGEA